MFGYALDEKLRFTCDCLDNPCAVSNLNLHKSIDQITTYRNSQRPQWTGMPAVAYANILFINHVKSSYVGDFDKVTGY